MKQSFSFDPASGNLLWRDYRMVDTIPGLTEYFNYDNLNRLINSRVVGGDTTSITYAANGNILSKSDAGSYTYDATKVNAVTDITGNPGTISLNDQTIEYNSYNLTTGITEGDSTYSILYNPLNQRIKTVYTPQTGTEITKYYSGGYEKTITGAVTKETHYISSSFGLVAIIVKQGENVQTYYVETDHLGSIIGLLNSDKTYAERASFDAWGRRRNPEDWSYQNKPVPEITDRGYTGHEHLDQFGLINMNGRMYDPVVGRFLGVDPIIQAPDFSQSFNGYSYCLNNPLNYVDQDGFVAAEPNIYDIVNSLWLSGGGYWSANNPDYYLPYYHDFDPREASLLEYSIINYLNFNLGGGGGFGGPSGSQKELYTVSPRWTRMKDPTGLGVRIWDKHGSGFYGSRRSSRDKGIRPHLGLDFIAIPGQFLMAPISGKLVYYNGKSFQYVDIIPDDPYINKVRICYIIAPDKISKYASQGSIIGQAADLDDIYPKAKDMINHVHVQVQVDVFGVGNRWVNPFPFFYDPSPWNKTYLDP